MVWKQPGISGVRNGGLPHPDMPGKLLAKAVEEIPKNQGFSLSPQMAGTSRRHC